MLVITGMHRSGTSMTAHLLYELGADFGDDNLLLRQDEWNEKGYFENREVLTVNDGLLLGNYALARDIWQGGRPGQVPFWRALRQSSLGHIWALWQGDADSIYEADGVGPALDRIGAAYRHTAVKDPRFALVIGAWRQATTIEKALYCYRHPNEVVRSLHRRSQHPHWLAYRVWKLYVRHFFQQASGIPTVIVNYNNFFDPVRRLDEARRLYAFLEQPFDAAQAAALLDDVIERRLWNNRHDDERLPRSVAALYRRLNARHADYATLTPARPFD